MWIVPPRIEAPVAMLALPSTTTLPFAIASPAAQPALRSTWIVAPELSPPQ